MLNNFTPEKFLLNCILFENMGVDRINSGDILRYFSIAMIPVLGITAL